MATDIQVKDTVNKFIDNVFNFDVLTTEKVQEKENDLKNYTTDEVFNKVSYIRPYVGVIQSITPRQVSIYSYTNNGTEADVTISFRKVSYTTKGDSIPTDALSTVHIHLVERNQQLLIDYFDELQDVLYAEYMANDYMFDVDVPTGTSIALDLQSNLKNLKNIKYMFKGQPNTNPLKTEEDIYIDTYNLLYWLFLEKGVELGYPLNVNYFRTEGKFYTIFGKGHKYKSNIPKIDIGDIIFFGRSDSNIGIYVGDNKFISIRGKFPKSDTSIAQHDLLELWDEFNGWVMRFDDEVIY